MYGTYEHATRIRSTRRGWLAVGGALAAVLVMVALIVAACNARADRTDPLAGADGTPTPAVEATVAPTDTAPGNGVGEPAGGNPDGGGAEPGGGDPPDDGEDAPDDGGDEPAPPLAIEVSVDTLTPGGQCFASGTIAVTGGEYPLTVHFQWRRLVQGEGLDGVPVTAVHNVTIHEPGEIAVQTDQLPEDGTNVMLNVTGPTDAYSGPVPYDGCTEGPGGIANPDDD